jgi:succinate dehydrogenase / fumarate reductase cytochrome b subunit
VGSPESYADFAKVVGNPFVKLILSGLVWAYLHHFCAGIRFLLLDVHVGVDKESSVKSARMVLIVSLVLTALLVTKLW